MKAIRIGLLCVLLAATLSITPGVAQVATQPDAGWPVLSFEKLIGDLDYPVHLANAGDGSGRLFIVEQGGRIRIYDNGLVGTPFLDIADRVRSPESRGGSEEGLLSLAFPPGYSSQHHFYVYYTNKNGDNQVSRFQLSSDPNVANPDSEEQIIYFEHPVNENHNGGQLAFGPDGYLYIGTGDGGGGGDPGENAQDPASLLGKLLRIDVETQPEPPFTATHWAYLPQIIRAEGLLQSTPAYRIPPDNPFVGRPGYREEIWALGLRNPWRFSFDRLAGDLFIADVGQQKWEEVDFQLASSTGGENYGWDNWEANECFEGPCGGSTGFVFPVFNYSHDNGNCSVSGGFIYRGLISQGLQDIYLFADYCSGVVWGLQRPASAWEAHTFAESAGGGISSFGEAENGELYLVQRADDTNGSGTGAIYHILGTAP